jgi:hypothetical protein
VGLFFHGSEVPLRFLNRYAESAGRRSTKKRLLARRCRPISVEPRSLLDCKLPD